MKRYRQTFEEIISKLSVIQAEWKDDLAKLIDLQNEGKITRIYTSLMFPELRDDLLLLRSEHGLDLKI